jgi:DNA-nicking Smr family endonuclease
VCAKTRPAEGGFFVACRSYFAETIGVPSDDPDEPVAIPITGELDLHTFRPSEIGSLLTDYFTACQQRGLLRVRVVHGKGTGTLRATVHAHLRRSPVVAGFAGGDEHSGSWGATLVTLKRDVSC